nr:PAS domain-containing protein [Paenibacillus turpanensis]
MSDAVYVIDKDKNIALLNEEAQRRFPGQELRVLTDILGNAEFYNLSHERIAEEQYPIYRALQGETVRNFKMIVRLPDRQYVTDMSTIPIFNEKSEIEKVIACSHDITELMEHRSNLEHLVEERSKELFIAHEKNNNILESVTDGFFALSQDWEITYVNQHVCRLTGKTKEELLQRHVWDLYPKDGPHSIFYQKYSQAMTDRIAIYFEAYGPSTERYYEIRVYPYHDGICVFLKDISEKKQYEQELKRLSQLDLIGQMAAGISHEVRNPMTAVRGFLQLLSKNQDFLNYKDTFHLMIEELDRANAIVTEFLSMGSNKLNEQKPQNINDIISGIAPLIQADALRHDHLLELDMKDVPSLMLSHNEIRQLILNLCRNGIEAMSDGKQLTIRTYVDQEHVILAVQDQGQGIRPEIMDRVGTPFFTTKENGTGLGLGVCHGIAARHNAVLEIVSGTEGTTVMVKFKTA